MECFIVDQSDVREASRELVLTGDEAHHVRVLRIRPGDGLIVTNLIGTCYACELIEFTEEKKEAATARCRIVSVLPDFGEPTRSVMLIQGLLSQPARWDWLLEKSTELGVRVIQPVTTEKTEHREPKPDRTDRVLRAAVKQCRRANKPWVPELSTLREALSVATEGGWSIFVLHEAASFEATLARSLEGIPTSVRIALAIGPEGGFTEKEVTFAREDFGARIVSLGKRRLRAETAAIAALAIAVQE